MPTPTDLEVYYEVQRIYDNVADNLRMAASYKQHNTTLYKQLEHRREVLSRVLEVFQPKHTVTK